MSIQHPDSVGKVRTILLFETVFHDSASGCTKLRLEIQNLKFLQDFWAHEVPPHPEQEALALAHIQAHPGIPLNELLALYPCLAVDVIWILLSTCRVFTDLSATLLMRHEQVTLYAEERQVPKVHQGELACVSTPLPDGGRPRIHVKIAHSALSF